MVFGKIYILTSKLTEKCYVGSTTYPYLSQRYNTHRVDFKNGTKDYQGLFGYDKEGKLIEPEIKLLEDVKCSTKEELIKREQEWINVYEDLCINKKRAYATPEQKKEQFDLSVKKYHNSEKGKLSMKKANLRASIKKMHPEISQQKEEIEKEKAQIDEDVGGYLTMCYEGIDSDYKDIYCNILDRQSILERKLKKHNKKNDTLNRYIKELTELCPEDPLLKTQK
jgi:hypothetical protein